MTNDAMRFIEWAREQGVPLKQFRLTSDSIDVELFEPLRKPADEGEAPKHKRIEVVDDDGGRP